MGEHDVRGAGRSPRGFEEVALRRIAGPAAGQHAVDDQAGSFQLLQLGAQPGLVGGRHPHRLAGHGARRQRQVQRIVVFEHLLFEQAAESRAQPRRAAPWAA